ncbi:hypothetical protein EJB05_53910, partial [Eragrostis curvula]
MMMDKAADASVIVLSFRGTEPFNMRDWSTDVNLSWLGMGTMGHVHIGFLKALGLQEEDGKDAGRAFPKQSPNADADKPFAYYRLRDIMNTLARTTSSKIAAVRGEPAAWSYEAGDGRAGCQLPGCGSAYAAPPACRYVDSHCGWKQEFQQDQALLGMGYSVKGLAFIKQFKEGFNESMVISKRFVKQVGGKISSKVKLVVPTGATYEVEVQLLHGDMAFANGWASFCQQTNFQIGQSAVFGYEGPGVFNVRLFDCDGAENILAYAPPYPEYLGDVQEHRYGAKGETEAETPSRMESGEGSREATQEASIRDGSEKHSSLQGHSGLLKRIHKCMLDGRYKEDRVPQPGSCKRL